MTVNPGDEFKIKAVPGPELLRRLVYLAALGNGSVLPGGMKSDGADGDSRSGKRKTEATMLLQLARLADPQYRALSEHINADFDLMDEASVQALQEIEQELREVRRRRDRALERAYRDERGRRIFITADERGAYYENGARLEDRTFAPLQDELRGKPTWDQLRGFRQREDDLLAERDQVHRNEAQRRELREDLAEGSISEEEARQRRQEIEASLPARVRGSYEALKAERAASGSAPDSRLSAGESAALNARATPAWQAAAGRLGGDSTDAPSAADSAAPGAAPPEPG